jgi:hypothetical protein
VIASQSFVKDGQVSTIDVLPLDLALWTEPGYEPNLDQLRSAAEASMMNVAIETLAKSNYEINAMIDWNGDFPGGHALDRDDLIATVSSLARYGTAATERPGTLPTPFLPARLGTTTGSDATLYVGGWSYVAAPRASTGDKVGEAILIGLLVVTVVAIVALVLSDSKSGGKGSSSGHSSSSLSGIGHASHAGTRHSGASGGGGVHLIGGGQLGGRDHGGGGNGGGGGGGGGHHARPIHFTASRGVEHFGPIRHTAERVLDAFGRTDTELMLETPDWVEDDDVPMEGEESQMYLEMTLVDNRTGVTLWHAHQTFPASASSAKDTARVAQTMLSKLPPRVLRTAAN